LVQFKRLQKAELHHIFKDLMKTRKKLNQSFYSVHAKNYRVQLQCSILYSSLIGMLSSIVSCEGLKRNTATIAKNVKTNKKHPRMLTFD